MADDEGNPDIATSKGADIVRKIVADKQFELSTADLTALGDALDIDHASVTKTSQLTEDRLVKLEQQTHALADAVVAITDPADAIAPAVQIVKETMKPGPHR
jgi:hypothetical protein